MRPQEDRDASAGVDVHVPFLARLRRAGANPAAFRNRGIFLWATLGIAVLAGLVLIPYVVPWTGPFAQRLATLAALVFLFSAPALWMGLGRRSFLIATILVLALYGITGWTGLVLPQGDLFVVAVLLGFAVFGLAGFNLVFVLEEIVYDAHRLLPKRLKSPAWAVVPSIALAGLVVGLPWWQAHGGLQLRALWYAALGSSVLMAAWWMFWLINQVEAAPSVIRELHLFVSGILLACALADAVPYLVDAEAYVPGLVAYVALLGTWVYVSYTTLQRTHFLLRGRNAAPWVAILLAATYAIVAHARSLVGTTGETLAVQDLFAQRMQYMIIGIALGIVFYVGRSAWRGLRILQRSDLLSDRGRNVAGKAARVAEGMLVTERRVGEATLGLLRALDEALPGSRAITKERLPARPAWELEAETLTLQRVQDERDE